MYDIATHMTISVSYCGIYKNSTHSGYWSQHLYVFKSNLKESNVYGCQLMKGYIQGSVKIGNDNIE